MPDRPLPPDLLTGHPVFARTALRLPPAPDLDVWLTAHPRTRRALVWERRLAQSPFRIAVRYDDWTLQEKYWLTAAFAEAWNGTLSSDGTPFANLVPPPDNEMPLTVLSPEDAQTLYFETTAACLAFDAALPADSPRRLEVQVDAVRAHLLDSRSRFEYISYYHGYRTVERFLPARAGYVVRWLHDLGLPGALTPRQIVAALIGYCGNFYHFAGAPNAFQYEATWHYRGACPMSRVIQKTVPDATKAAPSPWPEPLHYTAGCVGTTSFFEHALRPLNLQAVGVPVGDHILPSFPQLGLYLSHGDDPYRLKDHPEVAPDQLLIDQAQFDAWFGPDVPEAERKANIGRRAKELFGS